MNIKQIDVDNLSPAARIAFSNLEMAIAQMNLKDFDKALILLERAEKAEELRELAMVRRATCLAKMGKPEEGLQLTDQAIDEYGVSADKYDSKAKILRTLGRNDEWGQLLEKAVKLKPDAASFWYNLACYYAYVDEQEKCRRALETSIKIRPDFHTTAASDSDFERYFNEDWFKDIVAFK